MDAMNEIAAQYASYDTFVEDTQVWLGKRADRYHIYYNISRVSLVLLSVSLPAVPMLVRAAWSGKVQSGFALVIALLAAFEGLMKPGDNWRHFRSYQLALQRAKRIRDAKCLSLAMEKDPDKFTHKRMALHREFVTEVEDTLEQESKIYFEHQSRQAAQSSVVPTQPS
jgi:hypothetical protein